MGRIAGITAAQTRDRLLRAAADAFAERGYDGTRVSDIAAAAGVSNGALYAHFGCKAELLVAALRTHGRRVLTDLFAADPAQSVTDLLLETGLLLGRRDTECYLIVEALTAARRDAEVARAIRDYIEEHADWMAGLISLAQTEAEIDPALSPAAVAYFCLLLSIGSALYTPDLHSVGDGAWTAVLGRVAAALAPVRGPASEQAMARGATLDRPPGAEVAR